MISLCINEDCTCLFVSDSACLCVWQKETPLANAVFWAARKGNLALLQLLLNSGRVDVDCKDCVWTTFLNVSQCNQHCHRIMLYGVFQQYGTSALMVASYSGHYECVRELILQGADINLQREVCISSMLTLVL